jgi:enamine deaminase RidA (YjgF/YER057c/UK114 family)
MPREHFDLPQLQQLTDMIPGFHWAVKKNGFLFLAGMIGLDRDANVVEGLEGQVRQALENTKETLDLAGAKPEDIVQLMAFFKAGGDRSFPEEFGLVVAAKQEILPGAEPAGTAVRVSELFFPNLLVEIQVVAAVR